MRISKKSVITNSIIAAIFLVTGFAFGWSRGFRARTFSIHPLREAANEYRFINPLLTYDSDSADARVLAPLEKELRQLIKTKISDGDAQQISVSFREPVSARWFVINGDAEYSAASLLKVPTMMASFKKAEMDPEFLRRQVTYDGRYDEGAEQNYKPAKAIQRGDRYSIEELIEAMVVYSDNAAARLLHDYIDADFVREVYTDLGLSLPESNAASTLTVREYAYFFRILYNATYLTREFSEKALTLLSKSDFSAGLRAGVPSEIAVAQKFGERTLSRRAPDGTAVPFERQLHDCGIVYYPNQPYLLCVMTKGEDFDHLARTIQEMSQFVYNWVKNQKNE